MNENEISNLVYRGNSVGYIFDKMQCYREQVSTMVEALRIIGIDYSVGIDNIERRKYVLQEAEKLAEKIQSIGEDEVKNEK